MFHELYERKVNLVSLKDGIDLNTPAGLMIGSAAGLHGFSALAGNVDHLSADVEC
jgi:hypothetical protein